MGAEIFEIGDFSGVDSRSSPLRYPPGHALRCKNWIRKPNGVLQLRNGFTRPTMSSVNASTIHSAYQYETNAGVRTLLFSHGATLKTYTVGGGTVSTLTTLSNSNLWNAFFAKNRFYFGNGTDAKVYDGATLRDIGIRPPTDVEAAGVSVAYTTATTGTWTTTQFQGHDFFMSYYNPTTGEVSNRTQIGGRVTIGAINGSINITGLPDLSGVNTEWVKLIGRTPDGGDVPYALVDTGGAWIVVANATTTATYNNPDIDTNAELPTRNGLPPPFSKACWAQWRAYVIDDSDPHAIRFSESEYDSVGGLFVGSSPSCWPATNKTFFPTGEAARAVHSVDDEAWVWTRNHLGILTEFGGIYTSIGAPVVRWRGTWLGGIAGQRAFAKTPYGPFWVSADKQLLTRGANGPVPASEEYELALLAQIGDSNLDTVECSYLRDPANEIDRLYILAKDGSNNPLVFIHDFKLGGEGSEFSYTGMTPTTFARLPQQILSMRDQNGKMRLWSGATDGRFYQLEDGDSDNGSTYSADLISILNFGANVPTFADFEWHGDSNVKVTISPDLRLTLPQIGALDSLPIQQLFDERTSLNRAQVEQANQFMLIRLQLDSHHADGTLAYSSPVPHIPLEFYGRVYIGRGELGAGRGEGTRRP